MLIAFSIAPSGGSAAGDSLHDGVAAAVAVVRASGLPNHTDSMFTTIEGSWDEVFTVLKQAVDAASEYGTRVSVMLKADIRPAYTDEMNGKVQRLEEALAHHA